MRVSSDFLESIEGSQILVPSNSFPETDSPISLPFIWPICLQYWRLISNFLFFGNLGIDFLFHMYFLLVADSTYIALSLMYLMISDALLIQWRYMLLFHTLDLAILSIQ